MLLRPRHLHNTIFRVLGAKILQNIFLFYLRFSSHSYNLEIPASRWSYFFVFHFFPLFFWIICYNPFYLCCNYSIMTLILSLKMCQFTIIIDFYFIILLLFDNFLLEFFYG